MIQNTAYPQSTVIEKLKQKLSKNEPLQIVFFDLDSTMVVSPPNTKTDKVRKIFEDRGYVVAFVTSKTEEMIITENQRKKSVDFPRPIPHLNKNEDGKYVYADPFIMEPKGILDADLVVGSSGTNILIKQKEGGYKKDTAYLSHVNKSPKKWRKLILELINQVKKNALFISPIELAPIEFENNYTQGITNVYPPDYRVEVHFKNSSDEVLFTTSLTQLAVQNEIPLQFSDDSYPSENKFSTYISPQGTSKFQAVDHIIQSLCGELNIGPQKLEILIAGDSFPDLKMGLLSAITSNSIFLLVGNSHLTEYLFDESHFFANEYIKDMKKLLTKDSSKKGVYRYNESEEKIKKVVIGDQAFPGTKGPDTIIAYLESV